MFGSSSISGGSALLHCLDKVRFPPTIWADQADSPRSLGVANLGCGFYKGNGTFLELEKVVIRKLSVTTHSSLNDCLTAKRRPDLLSTVQNQSMTVTNVRLNIFLPLVNDLSS